MTAIVFHFGAADRLDYARRLLRKAASRGVRTLVRAEPNTAGTLDAALWELPATSFLTHCDLQGGEGMVRRSQVLLDEGRPAGPEVAHVPSVLVNLESEVPEGSGMFERIIEIVSVEPQDRQQARVRWKQYAAMGYTITSHDLSAGKEQS